MELAEGPLRIISRRMFFGKKTLGMCCASIISVQIRSAQAGKVSIFKTAGRGASHIFKSHDRDLTRGISDARSSPRVALVQRKYKAGKHGCHRTIITACETKSLSTYTWTIARTLARASKTQYFGCMETHASHIHDIEHYAKTHHLSQPLAPRDQLAQLGGRSPGCRPQLDSFLPSTTSSVPPSVKKSCPIHDLLHGLPFSVAF